MQNYFLNGIMDFLVLTKQLLVLRYHSAGKNGRRPYTHHVF